MIDSHTASPRSEVIVNRGGQAGAVFLRKWVGVEGLMPFSDAIVEEFDAVSITASENTHLAPAFLDTNLLKIIVRLVS